MRIMSKSAKHIEAHGLRARNLRSQMPHLSPMAHALKFSGSWQGQPAPVLRLLRVNVNVRSPPRRVARGTLLDRYLD